MNATIYVYQNYDRFDVRDAALQKITDYLAFDDVSFGQDIHFSDLVALMDGTDGVSHVDMTNPAADVKVGAGELATEGTTVIDAQWVAE